MVYKITQTVKPIIETTQKYLLNSWVIKNLGCFFFTISTLQLIFRIRTLLSLSYAQFYRLLSFVTFLCKTVKVLSSFEHCKRFTTVSDSHYTCHKMQIFHFHLHSVTKIIETTAIRTMSWFYTLFSLDNAEKQGVKLASSYVMGPLHCIGGQGVFLNKVFKITITLCHWLFEIFKAKEKWHSMQINQICFNASDYVTLHSIKNIMIENDTKITDKMP